MRERMVAEQLEARGIRDPRVLDAMRRVPRDRFVAPIHLPLAYADRALPIDAGQTISQPFIVAAMTEGLELTGTEHALEIGTGSGYQTAILAELARDVVSVERHASLAEAARDRLAALGYRNASVFVGDGSVGFPAQAPYDAILVAAAAPRVPDALKSQLADGARLVIPIGTRSDQTLTVVRRHGQAFETARHGSCVFVPLVGEQGWPA